MVPCKFKIYFISLTCITGLHTTKPGWESRLKDKEGRWIDNHQKYNVLTDSGKSNRRELDTKTEVTTRNNPNNSHSSSHNNSFQPSHTGDRNVRPMSATSVSRDEENLFREGQDDNEDAAPQSSRCFDSSVDKNQLIMLGMYHLNAEQERIYSDFVDMLSKFDSFDMVS